MVVGLDAHFHMSSGKLLLAEDKPPPYSGGWNLDYNMTGFIVALRQTLGARGLNLFQCITCAGHFILPYLHPTGQDSSITQ